MTRPLLISVSHYAAILLFVAGCGHGGLDLAPVTGTITLDGKPVSQAAVLFIPINGGRPATGVTDEQGRFTLFTLEVGDGALVGEHRVTVTRQELTGLNFSPGGLAGVPETGGLKIKWLIPKRYSNPDTSGLKVSVKHDGEPIHFSLDSAAK